MNTEISFLVIMSNKYLSFSKMKKGDQASSMQLAKFLINVDSWHKWQNSSYFICFKPFDNKTLDLCKLKLKFHLDIYVSIVNFINSL